MIPRICLNIKHLQLKNGFNQYFIHQNLYNNNYTKILSQNNCKYLHGHKNFVFLSTRKLKLLPNNFKTLSNPSILSENHCKYLHGHQDFGFLSTCKLKFLPNNLKTLSNPSILSQNHCKYLHGCHNFGSLSTCKLKTLPNNFKTLSNHSILSQNHFRYLHGHQNCGFLSTCKLKILPNNLKTLSNPSILSQNDCKYLHVHHSCGFLSILNLKTLPKNFKKPSMPYFFQPSRGLKLMEYQGDEILQASGIPTGKFVVVKNADDAEKMAESLQAKDFMVKAQVLTGGRGKGKFKNSKIGGVRIATTPKEVGKICKKMLGDYLVTKQTPDNGIICNVVLVAERHFPRKEFYFAITMHRAFDGPVVIASTQGGMDIEEVAIVDPEAVLYEPIDVIKGLQHEQAREITKKLQIVETPDKLAEILVNLYKIFEKDAILVELNPLALDIHNNYLCLDCKMEFDDSAEFKQPELFAKKDTSQLDPRELAAVEQNINYVALTGNIGCMVNGAGLAMATMDIIKLHGGEPANFLDVGGGATVKTVETCFEIITSNKDVDCIFVNIFGGIMRCDVIAQGIVAAAAKLKLKHMPIVCRLRGTNVSEAKAIIAASEMRILSIDDLDEGAKVAVKVSKIRHLAKEASLDVNFELIGI